MSVEDSVAPDQIRAFVERVERLSEEKDNIAKDISEVWAEAKGNGFDVKVLKRIVNIRKNQRSYEEQEAILELYMSALGMCAAPAEG